MMLDARRSPLKLPVTLVTVLALVAASVASINVFGGFLVANRMIRMFRKDA